MFLPKGWLPKLPQPASRFGRIAIWGVLFIATMGVATGLAQGLRSYAIANFYTVERENQVFLSTVALSDNQLGKIADIALASPEAAVANQAIADGQKLLNYVLPTTMYVSEIPMHLPAGETFGHSVPRAWDKTKFKVIFTSAEFGSGNLPEGGNILRHAVDKHPIIEVWVDLSAGKVVQSYRAPDVPFYGNHQVPLF